MPSNPSPSPRTSSHSGPDLARGDIPACTAGAKFVRATTPVPGHVCCETWRGGSEDRRRPAAVCLSVHVHNHGDHHAANGSPLSPAASGVESQTVIADPTSRQSHPPARDLPPTQSAPPPWPPDGARLRKPPRPQNRDVASTLCADRVRPGPGRGHPVCGAVDRNGWGELRDITIRIGGGMARGQGVEEMMDRFSCCLCARLSRGCVWHCWAATRTRVQVGWI